jgi:uncharacterized protein (DUF488 family)
MKLYTIGHSNHSIGKLASLLEDNGISQIVDVRTSPYSRFNPQYNREMLEAALTERGISYTFAGDSLGGRPDDPSCYKRSNQPSDNHADFLHEVDYPEVMKRDWFQRGIGRLMEMASSSVTAILCSEEDPAHCHRHHLITKYLLDQHPDVEIQHIRGDGVVFRAQMISASVDQPPSEQLSLF